MDSLLLAGQILVDIRLVDVGGADVHPDLVAGGRSPLRDGSVVNMAAADASQRSERMVVAIVTGLDVYQTTLLRGMCGMFATRGIPLLAYANYAGYVGDASTDAGAVIPSALACLLTHHRPRGVILMNPLSGEQGQALKDQLGALELPTVYLAQDVPSQTCVRADNVQGMRALMAHLLDECGVRVPAMIRGYAHHADHVERERVFREELERRGLTVQEDLFAQGQAEREVARNGLRRILDRRRDMDAVVTTDDWCAGAAMEVLVEAGLRVPEDVVVTGFDDYPIASLDWPGITTVDQDLDGQGALAARALLELMDGMPTGKAVLTPCRLVVRGSTRNSTYRMVTKHPNAGPVQEHCDQTTVEAIAKLARAHVGDHNAIRRTSRALSDCRNLQAVQAALASCVPLLGIRRCFLVIYDNEEAAEADGIAHRVARLIFDYRDGCSQAVSETTFSSCSLLPDGLSAELSQGYLALQLLFVTSGVLGYLLTDHPFGYVAVAESLQMDLGHALEAIFRTEELQSHAEMLEDLVKRRTVELQAEVTVRRRTEQELQRSLATDALTNIANRRAFQSYYEEQWSLHLATRDELSLLMVDVDLFKLYNDHYGHLKGDEALCTVASCLRRAVRYPHDLACRFGGEEFTAILPRCDQESGLIVARRFHELLAAAAIPHAASSVAPVVTASVGFAVTVPAVGTNPDVLLAAADRALYLAKEQGRNQIAVGCVTSSRLPGSSRCSRGPRWSLIP